MKDPYLRAETNFRRNGQSFISLMLVSARSRIFIHKESFVYKTDEDIFDGVGKMIRKHYAEYKAELPVLGKIVHYLYDHSDGNTYKFTTEGKLLDKIKETKEKNQC